MLLEHLFGANLFVAFICDPLNLNLFPPHVSGVAVGGAGSGVVSDGNEVMDRSSFLKMDFQVVLSVHSKQGHCHTVNNKKKRKRQGEGEEEEQGWVCGALFRSRFHLWQSSHPPLGLNWGPGPSPSP